MSKSKQPAPVALPVEVSVAAADEVPQTVAAIPRRRSRRYVLERGYRPRYLDEAK